MVIEKLSMTTKNSTIITFFIIFLHLLSLSILFSCRINICQLIILPFNNTFPTYQTFLIFLILFTILFKSLKYTLTNFPQHSLQFFQDLLILNLILFLHLLQNQCLLITIPLSIK